MAVGGDEDHVRPVVAGVVAEDWEAVAAVVVDPIWRCRVRDRVQGPVVEAAVEISRVVGVMTRRGVVGRDVRRPRRNCHRTAEVYLLPPRGGFIAEGCGG